MYSHQCRLYRTAKQLPFSTALWTVAVITPNIRTGAKLVPLFIASCHLLTKTVNMTAFMGHSRHLFLLFLPFQQLLHNINSRTQRGRTRAVGVEGEHADHGRQSHQSYNTTPKQSMLIGCYESCDKLNQLERII